MQLTRRTTMAAAAATFAASGVPRSVGAQAGAGARPVDQPPGFFRQRVGNLEVTRVHDGVTSRSLEGFIRNAELEAVKAQLAAAFQPTDNVVIPITTTVLRTPDQLVLIDTSRGEFAAPNASAWMANLQAAGVTPDEVDVIVVSHFHGDHIGGIRGKDGALAFPNARIMVPEAEWAFWMDEGQMSRAPEAMRSNFQNVRRVFEPIANDVARYGDGEELVPGLRAMAAPGHTPGHTAYLVEDGGSRLLVWSDTTNKPELFVRNPRWQAVFDMDGDQAMQTRLRLLDMAAAERLPVAGYHFPFPATGYIARDGGGYEMVPVFWQQSL